ncbi:acyl-CoA dehydrogenase family protein [Phytohabitans suffuscus]|uniref:Acyl-CoA dehydrogenase n=1 Tax=Phytohabitans suffuscus TaxID=624315 RepID=A0A6F8YR21_9ACTN|nr:acyl-CoA dehydrogenase family protein [Phytohabitans suffuscus]BCB88597.1 acyl-CoA dehydrogenase [Phytohabitans suffuscus]
MDPADLNEILKQTRHFVRSEVVPAEDEIEATDDIPERLRQRAKDMGLFGFAIPTEYGGLGLSMEEEAQLVMELGYAAPAFRSMFGTNNGIAGHTLLEGGSERQKGQWLPKLASGEWVASFALTEPDAGSDIAGLSTKATESADGWHITGQKRFITNAPAADVFMVYARTDPDSKAGRGVSAFFIPAGSRGLTVAPKDAKMGQAGAWTADVVLDDVLAPKTSMIGAPGTGYQTALKCLAHGRLHIAALCVGLAQRLVDESLTWAMTRQAGGHPISDFQLIQAMIADSQTELMAGRALVMDNARAFDRGTDRRLGPACAKYFTSEMVGRVADRAVQIHGGSGYMRGVPVERLYRDARLFRIYEGTSQIQQLVIAGQLLRSHQPARS